MRMKESEEYIEQNQKSDFKHCIIQSHWKKSATSLNILQSSDWNKWLQFIHQCLMKSRKKQNKASSYYYTSLYSYSDNNDYLFRHLQIKELQEISERLYVEQNRIWWNRYRNQK